VRPVLIAVFVLALLVFLWGFFKPVGPSGDVFPPAQLQTDAEQGHVEKVERGPKYSKVFISGGATYYIKTPDSLDPLLASTPGGPPPVEKVADPAALIVVVMLVAFVVLMATGCGLLWDWWRRNRDSEPVQAA
jgi:hypothetical protein